MNHPTRQQVIDHIANLKSEMLAQANAAATASGRQIPIDANVFTCIACEAGIAGVAAGLIAVAIAGFPEDLALIGPVAAAVGLSEATVTAIFSASAASGVAAIVTAICKALGSCD